MRHYDEHIVIIVPFGGVFLLRGNFFTAKAGNFRNLRDSRRSGLAFLGGARDRGFGGFAGNGRGVFLPAERANL